MPRLGSCLILLGVSSLGLAGLCFFWFSVAWTSQYVAFYGWIMELSGGEHGQEEIRQKTLWILGRSNVPFFVADVMLMACGVALLVAGRRLNKSLGGHRSVKPPESP